MKKLIDVLLLLLFSSLSLNAQLPSSFSWKDRHGYDYLPENAKDQIIQGPCGVFAAVAAVEAMCQIYYNNRGSSTGLFNFSEAYVYNAGAGGTLCTGIGCTNADAPSTLKLARDSGFIDDGSFQYHGNCLDDCSEYDFDPNQKVYLPYMNSFQIDPNSINTVDKLKQAILDYGPIIMMPGKKNGCALHPSPCDTWHTILLTGWSGSQWEIWDSWPGAPSFGLKTYDVFYYDPLFYRVYPVDPQNSNDSIRCVGIQSEYFSRKGRDDDKDGFYSWGLESYGRPKNCPGPNLMDWDDGYGSYIYRSGDTIYITPTVSGPSGKVCQSGGNPSGGLFELSYVPPRFSCSWYISKNAYCFNTYQGDGNSITIYPNYTCIGKESEITFKITQHGGNGYAEYKKSFYVNCPREDLMSYSVLDSYGGSPPKYGDTYYLCPYTTYNIFFNENDPDCSVTNLDWDLPYGWSEHYRYSNYISIYTNDWPDGFLEIKGKTTCSGDTEVTLMSPYFGAAECGGYFMAYPNPTGDFVDIDVDKTKLNAENISIDGKCLLTLTDKSGMIKFKTEFKGFPYRIDTANLPDGLYFVNIIYKGKSSTIRLIIKH